tara:strand:- start:515 stop:688 length:174 start_codon:yes stop_codon:yes gene_type:complete
MLAHISLSDYYRMIFIMSRHHEFSIDELEDTIPYERDIYFAMVVEYVKRMKESQEKG